MNYSSHTKQDGFVILFAVLISSIILLIGMGMFRISIKETVLSSTARESTLAFFMADSGMECALYAEIKHGLYDNEAPPYSISANLCDPRSPSTLRNAGGSSNTSAILFNLINLDMASCAQVRVENNNGVRGITSKGYNICNNGVPASNNPLLLQRELFISYTR